MALGLTINPIVSYSGTLTLDIQDPDFFFLEEMAITFLIDVGDPRVTGGIVEVLFTEQDIAASEFDIGGNPLSDIVPYGSFENAVTKIVEFPVATGGSEGFYLDFRLGFGIDLLPGHRDINPGILFGGSFLTARCDHPLPDDCAIGKIPDHGSFFERPDGNTAGWRLESSHFLTPIPLPAALPLMLAGLSGLWLMAQRRCGS